MKTAYKALLTLALCITISACGGGGGGSGESHSGNNGNSGGGQTSSDLSGKTLECSVKNAVTDPMSGAVWHSRNDHTLTFSGDRVTWTRWYYGPGETNGTRYVASGSYSYKKSGSKGTITITGLNFSPAWSPTNAIWELDFTLSTMGVTDVYTNGSLLISNWAFTLK